MPDVARPPLWHRLYVRIYVAVLVSLAIAAIGFGYAHLRYDPIQFGATADTFADLAAQALPAADAPAEQQQEALVRWRARGRGSLALYSRERALIAGVGRPLPPPPPDQAGSGRMLDRPGVFVLSLPDGRWLVAQRGPQRRAQNNLMLIIGVIAVLVGLGAYPVVRRLTRRLERLQGSVAAWGAGRLSTRVAVEGNDEVARLAASFNQSAARIEALVSAQKSLLANASHELRSPLARIRMAVELMGDQASPALRSELAMNIGELDLLIDEVLLASRLDAAGGAGDPAPAEVDLTAIVAEECARADATLDAQALTLVGDARLLRRMVRNLLENALRYGAGTAIEVSLALVDGRARLRVCDRGPGVPEAERERIFAPFYRVPGASEAAGGVGLGLSLVRQIAVHHGGEVVCLANPGGGSCFCVTLPLT
jgi:signal transduction histidine kinase